MKYYMLKESLKNDILSGIFKPGDKMPSEYQLVDCFGISRHTVRKALSILEDVLTKDIDGVIIEPSKSELACRHPKLYKTLESYEIPYIFIHGIYAEIKVPRLIEPELVIGDSCIERNYNKV